MISTKSEFKLVVGGEERWQTPRSPHPVDNDRVRGSGRYMRKAKRSEASEIRALKRMRESEIDTTDIPPTADWSKAVVGRFYRPIKKPVTIRLDADVLHWLKGQGNGYQTRINSILRRVMEKSSSNRPRSR